jgi:TatD DNase family protein
VIDAHAHLTDPRFQDDVDAVMERARRAGIARVLTAGEDVSSSEAAIRLAERHADVRVAVGVHPHRAGSWDDASARRLRELARDERVVAIGEIGIDLSGRSAPADAQDIAFREQLALAADLGLPVVLHVRDAGVKVRAVLAERAPMRGMVHCYSEGAAELPAWLALGLHISFAGTITYPTSAALRAAGAAVPAERLLAETDAPYLAPQNVRGRRNEPLYVAATHAKLAHERGEDLGDVTVRIAANAKALFGDRWGT